MTKKIREIKGKKGLQNLIDEKEKGGKIEGFNFKGTYHKIVYLDKQDILTVSEKDGFIIRTKYDTKEFPKILYREKQDIKEFLKSIGGEKNLIYKEMINDERDRNTWWNLNFYEGNLKF